MVKNDLLSNTGLSSTCCENAVNAKPDIHDVLDLLITQNTPEILSEELLSEKIKKIEYSRSVSDEEKKQYQIVLSQLSQLPTGKKLISMMPDDVVFGPQIQGTAADGHFMRYENTIEIDFRLPEIKKCEVIAHEIRHAIQYKYDPTYDGKTTYDFEKMIELDTRLQDFRISKEYTDLTKDDELIKAHQSCFSDYYQYQDYFKETPEISPESKLKIVNTLYAIDVWYGISDNFWRNIYNDQAVTNAGFSKNKNQQIEGRKYSAELDKQVKKAYIDNMKIGLPIEFFERDKDCSVVVNGYKLFERKNDDFGCSVTLFFKNGKPSYQTRLDKFGWKRHETYFYEDGLKRSEYQYNAGNYAFRCGEYTKYYDSVSQSGEQPIRERGIYEGKDGGYGFVYADNNEKKIEKRTYYPRGRLRSITTLSGPEKGKYTSFYNTAYRNIEYRMIVDEHGNGQGYFEKYRDNIGNSLEWSGQQVNSCWNGVCQKHSASGNVSEEVSFDMGKEGPVRTYFSDTGQKEKEVIYDKESGWTYHNYFSENGDCFRKSRYYKNGNIERSWCCAGEKKGECFVYYNNSEHQVRFRMTADKNGNGQGYFERYRDDKDNTLDMCGYQKDGNFDGPCKAYTQDGRLDYECVFKNGKKLGYEEGKAYLEKWKEKQKERQERKGLCARLDQMSQQMQPTQLRQKAKRELVKDFRKMYPKKGDDGR